MVWQEQLLAVFKCIYFILEFWFFEWYEGVDFIFEGSQGILLDMDYGFFLNVIWVYIIFCNVQAIIRCNGLLELEVFCIIWVCQIWYGNGFLSNEGIFVDLVFNFKEINQENEWQGQLCYGMLDVDFLCYVLQFEANYFVG